MKITPVILSGGSGSRLWPVSRSLNPKQFLDFFGDTSLFQESVLRSLPDQNFLDPIIICNNEHRFIVAEELQKIKVDAKSIILEPTSRNTAPAVAIAALDVIKNNAKNYDLMLVMPSDHIISEKKNFISAIKQAAKIANDGYLVTFGKSPTRAETGYGYIKCGKEIDAANNIFAVEKFIEKPDKKTAKSFLENKNYFWNSGIFLFKATRYLELLQKLQPEMFISCCNAYNKAKKDLDFIRLDAKYFEECQNISIDYAIMEKASEIALKPLNNDWLDVGSWDAIAEITKKDEDGNSLIGDVIALKSKNCYINSRHPLVTTIGVENLIIIALKDTVLIANKNNSQDVKELFELLKKRRREECQTHATVMRPWGSFEVIDIGDKFKVKKIIVKPKASLSLQTHDHRSEHWIVVRGVAHVTCESKEFILNEDQSTYVSVGKKHRLKNKGKIPLEIIEIQTGNYLGEDDITRFSDDYGR